MGPSELYDCIVCTTPAADEPEAAPTDSVQVISKKTCTDLCPFFVLYFLSFLFVLHCFCLPLLLTS